MNKKELSEHINKALGTSIDFTRLKKRDIETLYNLTKDLQHFIIEMGKKRFGEKLDDLGEIVKDRIHERVDDFLNGL